MYKDTIKRVQNQIYLALPSGRWAPRGGGDAAAEEVSPPRGAIRRGKMAEASDEGVKKRPGGCPGREG